MYEVVSVSRIASECPLCNRILLHRRRRDQQNDFMGCSGYPRCTFTEPFDANVDRIGRELRVAQDDCSYLRELLSNTKSSLLALQSIATPDIRVRLEVITRYL